MNNNKTTTFNWCRKGKIECIPYFTKKKKGEDKGKKNKVFGSYVFHKAKKIGKSLSKYPSMYYGKEPPTILGISIKFKRLGLFFSFGSW